MSILIKGIRIPKCDWTRILILLPDGRCIDEFGNTLEVVALPPHGRLIDADALMKHKGNCYDADGHLLYAVGTGSIMCAPTIIESEGE